MLKENPIYELSNNLSILLDNAPKGFSKEKIQAIINRLSAPLQVMIMGEFSVGKSTFINALLKQEVAITSPIPTTAVITKFSYGSKDKIIVHFLDGTQKEYAVNEFNKLTVENDGRYQEMHAKIKYVERQLPNELLKTYNFIDSPGRNAIVEKHEEVTRNFVENADAMLWLFSIDQMGGQTEKEVLQSFSKRLKPIAIVNKVDLVEDDDELDELLEELQLNFKNEIVTAVPISADYALQGILTNDRNLLEASNFSKVYDELSQYFGEKEIYLKTQKMMQDFAYALALLAKRAKESDEDIFRSLNDSYDSYVDRLRKMLNTNDVVVNTLNRIVLLLTEIIGKKELPESNSNYMSIVSIKNSWKDNCKKLLGITLYNALYGDAASQYEYAKRQSNQDAATYWYQESGLNGYLPAQQVLYTNYTPAGYWLERAAQNGDKYAILQIALSYYYGRNNVALNMEHAVYWLKEAVKYEQSGVSEAMYCLAYLYKNGIVVDTDYNKAYELSMSAQNRGYIPAMGLAAELIYNGQGVVQDKIDAFLLWRKGGFNEEIYKYFVEDNFDLHRKIADDFCDRKAGSNRADRKYSTAYFWYDLDFIRNNNADSACKCGNICEQDEEFDKALLWYDKAAAMWDIAGIKQAGDICFYQMKQKLHSMGYYTKGMFKGDGYCAGMLSKYIFRRCLQVFVVYAAISVIVHVIGMHAYGVRNEEIADDNHAFIEAKAYLDGVKKDYQNGVYKVKSDNDSTVSVFSKNISILKKLSEKVPKDEQEFHASYDKYRDIDKYFLFSDYVMDNYLILIDSQVTNQYNHDYDDILYSMKKDEERIRNSRAARDNRNTRQENSADFQLSQSDIKDAARLFCAYHEKLTDHNFDGAYAMLTDKRQSNLGSSSKLVEQYRNTLESTVTDITCKDIDGNEVIFNYELRARDKVKGPKILVQYYEGEVHLFKNKGQWRIGYAESKKVSERYE